MGFFACTSKVILFLFNLIVLLLSLGILGTGIYVYMTSKNYGGDMNGAAIIIMIIGCVSALIAFLGCWGAIHESRCFLNLYASILLILLLILIVIGAWILIKRGDIEQWFGLIIDDTFDKAAKNDTQSTEAVNGIQIYFHCCGTTGPAYWTLKKRSLPYTCCYDSMPQNNSTLKPCTIVNANPKGCSEEVLGLLKMCTKYIGVIAIIIGAIKLGGVIFAFILSNSIKKQNLRRQH